MYESMKTKEDTHNMQLANISVKFVNSMGDDLTVVNSARISLGKESMVLSARDEKLIKYLADHNHMSPFEHCMATMIIKCPLYIRSQIHRHRTFSYNEISRRYTSEDIEFYIPDVFYGQDDKNTQASKKDEIGIAYEQINEMFMYATISSLRYYQRLIEVGGVSREQARAVLPQNLMTKFYMTGNLRNWAAFIALRKSEDAQEEIRRIANECQDILRTLFPHSLDALLGKGV